MRTSDPIAVIEAAYRTELPQDAWLQDIAGAVSKAFGGTGGALSLLYDARRDDWIEPLGLGLHALNPELARSLFFSNVPAATEADARAAVQAVRTTGFGSFRDVIAPRIPGLGNVLNHFGVEDLICINATDPTHIGCAVCVPDRRRTRSLRLVTLWRRLAAHIAAGNRLRRVLSTLATEDVNPVERAEAVLSSPQRIEHAVGVAESKGAREVLKSALARIDEARAERSDAWRAVDLWQGLVAGRWSIVEHFERDGRRYYLAYKNDPSLAPDRALTRRERQVLAYAALGHSNKLIAYTLGLSVSTVSTHLTRARMKLGCAVPPEIAQVLPVPKDAKRGSPGGSGKRGGQDRS